MQNATSHTEMCRMADIILHTIWDCVYECGATIVHPAHQPKTRPRYMIRRLQMRLRWRTRTAQKHSLGPRQSVAPRITPAQRCGRSRESALCERTRSRVMSDMTLWHRSSMSAANARDTSDPDDNRSSLYCMKGRNASHVRLCVCVGMVLLVH